LIFQSINAHRVSEFADKHIAATLYSLDKLFYLVRTQLKLFVICRYIERYASMLYQGDYLSKTVGLSRRARLADWYFEVRAFKTKPEVWF
jgi:hypothetical protein